MNQNRFTASVMPRRFLRGNNSAQSVSCDTHGIMKNGKEIIESNGKKYLLSLLAVRLTSMTVMPCEVCLSETDIRWQKKMKTLMCMSSILAP